MLCVADVQGKHLACLKNIRIVMLCWWLVPELFNFGILDLGGWLLHLVKQQRNFWLLLVIFVVHLGCSGSSLTSFLAKTKQQKKAAEHRELDTIFFTQSGPFSFYYTFSTSEHTTPLKVDPPSKIVVTSSPPPPKKKKRRENYWVHFLFLVVWDSFGAFWWVVSPVKWKRIALFKWKLCGVKSLTHFIQFAQLIGLHWNLE